MEDIFDLIDRSKKLTIDLEAELTSRVALGPENGGDGEHEKVEYVKDLLETLHPDHSEIYRAPDKRARHGFRPNLVARWDGLEHGPTVWVLCHADIVPPGDISLWNSDPYEVVVDGDRIIGRGVEDNQHGLVSFYIAARSIFERGLKPSRSIGLVLVADEETGSDYGLKFLLNNHRDIFRDDDLIIVPDGGNEEGSMIEIAEKSMLWLRFTVKGKQCHASTPEKGKNSLMATARLIVSLKDSLKKGFNRTDEIFSPPLSTFEPTKIEANVQNVNTIPGKDVFYMDCRVLPIYNLDTVLSSISDVTGNLARSEGVDVELETIYRVDAPDPTPVDAPVVLALKKAIKAVKGIDARPMGIGGGTVAAFFRKAGLPAAVWSTVSDSAHQPNEFCLISNIISDAKVFAFIFMAQDKKIS